MTILGKLNVSVFFFKFLYFLIFLMFPITFVSICSLFGTDRGSRGDRFEGGAVPDLHHAVVAGGVDQVVGVDQGVDDLLVALRTRGCLCNAR